MGMKNVPLMLAAAVAAVTAATARAEEIRIETARTAIVLDAKQGKEVGWLYWGAKADEGARKRWRGPLLSCFGGWAEWDPALRVTHADGSLTTELAFAGCERQTLDANRTRTTLILKDPLYPLTVRVAFTAYAKEDVITQQVTLTHQEPGDITVHAMASTAPTLPEGDWWLTSFQNRFLDNWPNEMHVYEERLSPGTKRLANYRSTRSAYFENPAVLISQGPAQEEAGEVYGIAVAWTGNWEIDLAMDTGRAVRAKAGMAALAADYKLPPDTPYVSPEAILTHSSAGKGQISRNLHDYARNHVLVDGDKPNPILLNSWEGVYFTFDEAKIKEMIKDAAEMGLELFVLDDGWFGNGEYARDAANAGLGDWQVNAKKLPCGLQGLADYAKSLGIRFGLWVELEMVNPKSALAKAHPEWVVKSGKREILQGRSQWLLDLTNPAVQDFVVETFDRILREAPGISYIKWDANRTVANVGSGYLPKDRQANFWYDYARGLYSVYARIRERHPHLQMQVCASGGGRVDYGALAYHNEFWTSDNTSAIRRIYIQWGTSHFYPAKAMAAHFSRSGVGNPLKEPFPASFRLHVALSGRFGFELQPSHLTEQERKTAEAGIRAAKEYIRDIVQFGDLYRLHSPYLRDGYAALSYVAKDKSQAFVFAYSLDTAYDKGPLRLRLAGLDPAKTYAIEEVLTPDGRKPLAVSGQKRAGADLMREGLTLPLAKLYDSCILRLRAL